MKKRAFIYPGQGSQRVGMGAEVERAAPELYERYLAAADSISGLEVRRFSREGPIESLTRTDVAQPALFALSLALTDLARQNGLQPDIVAGHSLGEYTAAVASGALGVDEGMALVCERGRLMAEVQSQRPGAMAAVIGLSADDLAALCEQAASAGIVALANLNSPTQIVVSGEEAAVETVSTLAQAAGASRIVRLQVGAAFHSVLMEPVQARLRETMAKLSWNQPSTPLVANWSARLLATGEEIREALATQITSPVRWVECVQTLVDAGCQSFIELGPGRALGGLVRQISPGVATLSTESPDKLVADADAAAEDRPGSER